ncbi:Uma2 family endonuclease [Spirillospora sp. NPDC052269]
MSKCSGQVQLEGFLELGVPEGLRAELIEGEIVVTVAFTARREKCLSRLSRQVARMSATPMDFSRKAGLLLSGGDSCTQNYVIPDGVFASTELDVFDSETTWTSPRGVAMAVEVRSGRVGCDRTARQHCYAKAAVPFLLLIDQEERHVTLFSTPDRRAADYSETRRVRFGRSLDLPEPFGFALDTAEFE